MAKFKTIYFSSFQSNQQSVDEDRRRSGKKSYTDYTYVDITSVVSKAIRIVTVFRFANFSSQPTKTPNEQKKIIPYRFSGIRRYLHSQGFSGKTTKILSKSWRKSTNIQYEYSWRKWFMWCNCKQINPFKPTVKQFLDYFSILFHYGRSYSCVCSHKSAICQTLTMIGNRNFDNNYFIKGIVNMRPPVSRYIFTWYVGQLLKYVGSLYPLDDLPLKMVTLKCVAFGGSSNRTEITNT